MSCLQGGVNVQCGAGNDATLTSLGLCHAGECPGKLLDIIIVALNAIYLKDLNFLLYFSFINTNST